MLQRIQTIFLSLLALTMVAFLILPLWEKKILLTGQTYQLYAWKLVITDGAALQTYYKPYMVLGILASIIAIMALYALFCFNNRGRQLVVGTFNNLLLTILLGLTIYCIVSNREEGLLQAKRYYCMGFFMPLIGILVNIGTNYFIRRDEALVQSTNRIR
jgi:hypothetical protein